MLQIKRTASVGKRIHNPFNPQPQDLRSWWHIVGKKRLLSFAVGAGVSAVICLAVSSQVYTKAWNDGFSTAESRAVELHRLEVQRLAAKHEKEVEVHKARIAELEQAAEAAATRRAEPPTRRRRVRRRVPTSKKPKSGGWSSIFGN